MSGASAAYRPRRSVLYMPSSNERALEKAKTLPVDGLILDLEDAVAPDAKAAARENACTAAASGEYGTREVTIRVNGIGTAVARRRPRGRAAPPDPTAIVVPKVNSRRRGALAGRGHGAAGAPERTRAVGHGRDAGGRAARRARSPRPPSGWRCWSWAPTTSSRSSAPSTCRAGAAARPRCRWRCSPPGAPASRSSTGSTTTSRTSTGFEAECRQGRDLGFDGKTLIHPGQVGPCNEVFAPSADEVEEARGVLAAWEAGAGAGVVTHRGRMVENLHVEIARKVIATDEAIRNRG